LQDFAQKKTPRFLRTFQFLLGIFEVPRNLKNPNFTEEKNTPFFPWSQVILGGPLRLPAVKGSTLKSALFGENLKVPGTLFLGFWDFMRFVSYRVSAGGVGGGGPIYA
jgi:hypothetical protein